MAGTKKSLWKRLLMGVVIVATGAIGASTVMLTSWSDVSDVDATQAAAAFDAAITEAGGGPAYIEIGESVTSHPELEGPAAVDVDALHLLTWRPGDGELREVRFPFWFVRMKTSGSLNLGTLTALLVGDWENLDLQVSVDQLERLGQALVLDHVREDGSRVLLWTEAAD